MRRRPNLTDYDVENVQTLLNAGLTHAKIAEMLKMSQTSVQRISSGQQARQKKMLPENDLHCDKTTDELLTEIIKRLDHLLSLRSNN